MHWLIKERVNKLNSNHLKDLNPYQLDETINDVMISLMHNTLKGQSMVEVFQQKTEMLSPFLVKNPDQPFIPLKKVATIGRNDVFKAKKSDLLFDYNYKARVYAETNCGLVNVSLENSDNLNYVLEKDTHLRPSKKWKRLVGTFDNEGFTIYAEKGHNVQKLYVEYYRLPKPVFLGGYDTIEYVECKKKNTADCSKYYSKKDDPVDCEYPESFHSLIVDLAVKEIFRKLNFPNGIQLEQEKINFITNTN